MARRRYNRRNQAIKLSSYSSEELKRFITEQKSKLSSLKDQLDEQITKQNYTNQLEEDIQLWHDEIYQILEENNKKINSRGLFEKLFTNTNKSVPDVQNKTDILHKKVHQAIEDNPQIFGAVGKIYYFSRKDIETQIRRYSHSRVFKSLYVIIIGLKRDLNKCTSLIDEAEKNLIKQAKIESLNEEKKKKEQRNKAIVASYTNQSRQAAESIKNDLKVNDFCPYCGNSIGQNPHADHLYPISLGGFSVEENMVYVCSDCNLKKGSMTLREFIQKHNIDRDKVEENLQRLNKKF